MVRAPSLSIEHMFLTSSDTPSFAHAPKLSAIELLLVSRARKSTRTDATHERAPVRHPSEKSVVY
jgi:hypothetical protein